jgi:hypothetical protein
MPIADCLPPTPKNAIGLVGSMSNYATPPQLVECVPDRDVGEMHHFARRWRDEHRGKWFTVPKLERLRSMLIGPPAHGVPRLADRTTCNRFRGAPGSRRPPPPSLASSRLVAALRAGLECSAPPVRTDLSS